MSRAQLAPRARSRPMNPGGELARVGPGGARRAEECETPLRCGASSEECHG